MSLCCQREDRRDAVRQLPGWNGLDYVEVDEDQKTLRASFLGKLPAEFLARDADLTRLLRIEGGRRITGIRVTHVETVPSEDPETDDFLRLRLDRHGDFSTYSLRLVGIRNVDPRYESAQFSFKVACPSDLDCAPRPVRAPTSLTEPNVSYLAKDYASFRQLLLDRLALTLPDWKERHVPDLGITLVELLAYVGDQLSYFQDAVATEAYLDTARQRISLRRHARLVDYVLHEGCNARAWVCVQTENDLSLPLEELAFATRGSGELDAEPNLLTRGQLATLPTASYEFFEPLLPACARSASGEVLFRSAHNTLRFYTWGNRLCRLGRGSTSATLLDAWVGEVNAAARPHPPPLTHVPAERTTPASEPNAPVPRSSADVEPAEQTAPRLLQLVVGDVLIFEEVISPETGLSADADPAHRHAVRLTRVTPGVDPVVRTPSGRPTPVVEIEWSADDALPFVLRLSALGAAPDCAYLEDLSVARGNVVLVDHGRTVPEEELGTVQTLRTEATCECAGQPGDVEVTAQTFSPQLKHQPLTWREPLPGGGGTSGGPASAKRLLLQHVRRAVPQVSLTGRPAETWKPVAGWEPRPDLIGSGALDRHFVVETDNEGAAHLRFGDGRAGRRPEAGLLFHARYRVGNGPAGNVGAGTISRLVTTRIELHGASITVRNPLPACGGEAAEPMPEARLLAPHGFRTRIERAITPDDYARIARRDPWGEDEEPNPAVQGAHASLVWTGSWNEAVVAIDPRGGQRLPEALRRGIQGCLARYRRIGHDLRVLAARYVPLDLQLEVCAAGAFLGAHVKAALLDAFSNRALTDGRRGFFHPDRLTFGSDVAVSRIVAEAQSIPGVASVRVTRLERLFEGPNDEIKNGLLPLAADEIARLDNDPNYPERGKLDIQVCGGR